MKKILLASTALVGFAGAAAAEVSLSGYAEMGVAGGNGGSIDATFWSDLDMTLNFSGSSDSGLDFGATIDIDELGDDCAKATLTAPVATTGGSSISSVCVGGDPIGAISGDEQSIYVSGSFGKVTLGDTDGAFDWALSEIYSGTGLADDHSTHAGAYWFTGLDGSYDGQVARYEYSFGDFGAAMSLEMDDSGVGDPVIGLGAKWSGDMGGSTVSAGIGYQDNGTNSVWGLSGSYASASGFSVSAGYADLDGTNDTVGNGIAANDWWGLAAAYKMDALTVGVNYGEYDAVAAGDSNPGGWGLVANYDLGGGAVFMAAYGDSSGTSAGGSTYGAGNGLGSETWSIGLGLSF